MDEFVIINNTDDLAALEKNKSEFDAQSHYWRVRSNERSIELYGEDNITRYNRMKAELIKNANPDSKYTDFVKDISDLEESGFYVAPETSDTLFDNWEEKLEKCKVEEQNNGCILVYTDFMENEVEEELTKLNTKFNDYLNQPESYRDRSDSLAINIFGINNHVLYYRIKAKLLEDVESRVADDEDEDLDDEMNYRDSINIEASNYFDYIRRYDRIADLQKTLNEGVISNTDAVKTDMILKQISKPLDFDDVVPKYVPNLSVDEMRKLGILSSDNYYADSKSNKINLLSHYECDDYLDGPEYKKLIESSYFNMNHTSDTDLEKQSLLELGWNPEVTPNERNFKIARNRLVKRLNEKYNAIDILDLSRYDSREDLSIHESFGDDELYPVYIVCTYTYSEIGRVIKQITKAKYSHAAIGFDSGLNTLFSFNMNTAKKHGGLSFESIEGYERDSDIAEIFVGVVFLNHHDYNKIKSNIEWYIANYDKCNYSITNLFKILINKSINKKYQMNMVCSQFVDSLFKLVNIDLSGKPSNLATPKDISNTKNNKVFILYDGLSKNYDKAKTDRMIKSLKKKYIKNLTGDNLVTESVDLNRALVSTYLEDLEKYSLPYKLTEIKPLRDKFRPEKCTWWYCGIGDNPSELDEEQFFKTLDDAVHQYCKDEYFQKAEDDKIIMNVFVKPNNYFDEDMLNVGYVKVSPDKSYKFYNLATNSYDESTLLERTSPIKIDDTHIIIETPKDFENEYQKSHALLIEYDKLENIEPMKYELAKLWFINTVLEQKISKPKTKDKGTLIKLRARVMNDFKKYIKVVMSSQNDFNFSEYYNASPFSDTNIKVDKITINKSLELLKKIISK